MANDKSPLTVRIEQQKLREVEEARRLAVQKGQEGKLDDAERERIHKKVKESDLFSVGGERGG